MDFNPLGQGAALGISGCGRFAPSPSGDLHIGNLRTAVLAWMWARRSHRELALRIEDIDRVRPGAAERQMEDLATIGLTWVEPVLWQSRRHAAHVEALQRLAKRDLLFECYCSRRDIASAAAAPHARPGFYPGTCLNLSQSQRRTARERLAAMGRKPALRLRPAVPHWQVNDELHGTVTEPIDAVVLQRGDGTIAYNLVVVVDDAYQGVDQVVRADDLLFTAPTQSYIAHELGLPPVTYVHVPLVVNEAGQRLAKRDGAVTLRDLIAAGWSVADVINYIARSIGATTPVETLEDLTQQFRPQALSRDPWVFIPPRA